MSKYLDKAVLAKLNEYRKKIFVLREQAYKEFGIDLLDNDTLSALSMGNIIEQYDSEYNINFARNGEDAKSGEVLIENKASRVEKKKRSGLYPSASFQFHAQGNIEYDRYIFATRDRVTLDLIRIYDISNPVNLKLVQENLLAQRKEWEDRCAINKKYMKRDVISLPEDILIKSLANSTKQIIDNCEVIRA